MAKRGDKTTDPVESVIEQPTPFGQEGLQKANIYKRPNVLGLWTQNKTPVIDS